MGLRGPQKKIDNDVRLRLQDDDCPPYLTDHAADFWREKVDTLTQRGLLTEDTKQSFIVVCDLWRQIQDNIEQGKSGSRQHLDTIKQYSALAKLFRLLPNDPLPPKDIKGNKFEF